MTWKLAFAVLAAVFALGFSVMPGGLRDVDDVNSTSVQNALRFAVAEHNGRSNSAFLSQVSRVIRVQSQVVAGMMYYMTVEMERTGCRKSNASEACAIQQDSANATRYQCTFKVWVREWLDSIKLEKEKC